MNIETIREGEDREDGFTLIELMVVVLVIAILLAIAVPTFLGARSRAQNSVAKSSLRTALSAANVLYTDTSSFNPISQSSLNTAEASLSWSAASSTASTDAKTISWGAANSGADFYAAAYSASGTCYFLKSVSGAVSYGTTSGSSNCNANYGMLTATYASAWTS
ncbi:MAG: type II secretion system protein [Acidimicrobiia bacterium]